MLRTGLRVVRRAPGEVQVGTDPRWAVRVDDLTPDEVRALVALSQGVPLSLLAAGLDPRRLADLAAQLDAAGLTAPGGTRALTGPAGDDARVLSLLDPDAAGTARVVRRAQRTVGVVGLGATGLGVAVTLAAAGVGRLLLDDDRPVRSGDVGPGGYRFQDVGYARVAAAVGVLAAVAPATAAAAVTGGVSAPPAAGPTGAGTCTGTCTGTEADLVVVVSDDVVEPTLGALLLNRGTPHLSVVLREADTVVGPLVVPGEGPCLRCLDLHRTDVDPGWPVVAAALGTRAARPAATGRPGTRLPPPEPPAVVAVASGTAAAAALAFLDTGASALAGTTVEIGLPDALPRRRRWAVHPACGCTAHRCVVDVATSRAAREAPADLSVDEPPGGPADARVRPPGSCADGLAHASSGRPRRR
ncbi:ThiF family adenylyltransferase [Cellulomonas palmilytica]|uniref:ThiF family adenylyltransferase n=1 Tax=Cellulomonas palmilytica TaxID=2608402 RepID=UPI001F2B86AC|nr:ThiF family adenylyltransferase [Cellulomonas palmilytica]UJP39653.1 ThiF family adenylyltransferase [Cellulomonas palmilytica]